MHTCDTLSEYLTLLLRKIFIVLELITGGELFDKIVSEGRYVPEYCKKTPLTLRHRIDSLRQLLAFTSNSW